MNREVNTKIHSTECRSYKRIKTRVQIIKAPTFL